MAKGNIELTNFIFEIANMLRGPYRPPQYRKVMLPMIVLRRLDLVTAQSKEVIIKERDRLEAKGLKGDGLYRALARKVNGARQQSLYNTSPFTFEKLLGDADNIAPNLAAFINGFSPEARMIFEKFKFEQEIEKLDNSNRLFKLIQAFADPRIDLHPDKVSNIEMGLIFEDLVRRFNEQANEEAGDHFTPREVIRLMAHLVFTEDEDVYQKGIARSIYDPTCGTGGMLSVSEEYINEQNPDAHLELFGQEYNDESWAICCSDLLIKDEPVGNIVLGDTLGDGKTFDGHPNKRFHYMLANPPFGVEWKLQEDIVRKEYNDLGFSGRFGPGLPKISDGATLFLLHMMSKMHPSPDQGGEGSKIAVVFNGSPLFNGEPGPSESNIRRWIIENDMLDAIVALPDQMFYNTGIYTYVWLVTNRKTEERKGKVQLIDATRHFIKMKKSLGDKRNKIGGYEVGEPDQIGEITRLYAQNQDGATSKITINGEEIERVCSKIFSNNDFGYLKVTVEQPLRLKFQAFQDGFERLKQETSFVNLATSKKRKNKDAYLAEIKAGEEQQERILDILGQLDDTKIYMDRKDWETELKTIFKKAGESLPAPIKKAIQSAFGTRDENAAICMKANGDYEPDPELRDTEIIPLPADLVLSETILGYDKKADNTKLIELVRDHCEAYLKKEVAPYVDQPWIDYSKIKVGYEIPINRHFYVYEPPRPLEDIESDIRDLEGDILKMLKQVGV